jgi:hypothetical protein
MKFILQTTSPVLGGQAEFHNLCANHTFTLEALGILFLEEILFHSLDLDWFYGENDNAMDVSFNATLEPFLRIGR